MKEFQSHWSSIVVDIQICNEKNNEQRANENDINVACIFRENRKKKNVLMTNTNAKAIFKNSIFFTCMLELVTRIYRKLSNQ